MQSITYFPDNNILIGYISSNSTLNIDSTKVVDNTGLGGKLNGILTIGIQNEFYGISNDDSLSHGFEIGYQILEDSKVTKDIDIFKKQIKYESKKSQLTSDRVVLEEIYGQIVRYYTGKFDDFKLVDEISKLQVNMKARRKKIYDRFGLCNKIQINEFENFIKSYKKDVDILRDKLKKVFKIRPEQEDSDKRDNEHIVEATGYCFTNKNTISDSWFVTADYYRTSRYTFDTDSKEASDKIYELFKIAINIRTLEQFINHFKLT